MNRKMISGLIGIIVGGAWFFANLPHYKTQGLTAIGMPLIIAGLGVVYLAMGLRQR